MKKTMRILATLTLFAMLLTTLLLPAYADGETSQAAGKTPFWSLSASNAETYKLGGTVKTGIGVDGTANSAIYFDGSTYYGDSNLHETKSSLTSMTVSMWLKPDKVYSDGLYDGDAKRGNLFHSAGWNAGNGVAQMYLIKSDVYFGVKSVITSPYGVNFTVLNNWVLLTVTYDSAAKKAIVYYDGMKVGETEFTATHGILFSGDMRIGVNIDSNPSKLGFYTGWMEDFRIYDSVLTETEVVALYNEKAPKSSGASVLFSDAELTAAAAGTHTTVAGINGGTALQFDGQTYYTSSNLNAQTCDQITFAAWVNPEGTYAHNPAKSRGVLFNSTSWVDGCMQLYFGSDSLQYAIKMNGTSNPEPSYSYNGAWTHIAATYNKTTGVMAYYCNGQFVKAAVVASAMSVKFNNLTIGRAVNDAEPGFYKGLMQDVKIYNGVLSASEISELATFNGAINKVSVTVTDDYLLNFFVDNAFDRGTSQSVTVMRDGKTVTPVTSTVDGGSTKYSVAVLPQHFGDEITVTASGKVGGKDQTYTKTYSIARYCTDTLADEGSSAELKALVTSILHYGAEAQKVAGYKTDALIDADLSTPTYAAPNSATVKAVDNKENGVTFTAADLRLDSKVALKVYCTGTPSADLTVTVGGRAAAFKVENGYILIEGIVPTEYDSAIMITDGEDGSTMTYSVNCYLAALNASELADANKTLGLTLYAVGVNAVAYANTNA